MTARLRPWWAVLTLLVLLPSCLVLGLRLPDDWQHHGGRSLPGTAEVTSVASVRGGLVQEVSVRDARGVVVGAGLEVNGESPERVGARFPVQFVTGADGRAQAVYVRGHDPLVVNLTIFVPVAFATLVAVAAATRRAARARGARRGRDSTGQYRARA